MNNVDTTRLPLPRAWIILALVLVLLLGFGLRAANLGDKNVWWDEAWTIVAARQGLSDLTLQIASDVHPPLYFWLLHGWMTLVGDSEFAARFLSLIWGILTVALTYPLAKRFTSRHTALLAALLTALSRFHIWWSQEARMYTLATLAVILSLYLFSKVLRKNKRRSWLLYTLATALVPYSFYAAVVVMVAQNGFVLLTLRRRLQADRHFLHKWIASQVTVVVAFAPWAFLATRNMRTWSSSTYFAPGLFAQLYLTLLSTGISTNIERWLIPTVVVTLAAIVGFVALWRERGWRRAMLLTLPLVLLPVLVYLLSLNRGLFYSPRIEARYLVLFAPVFYTLVAYGVTFAARQLRYIGWLSLALLLALNGWLLNDYHAARYMRDDYHTAMLTLKAYAASDDAVLLVSGSRYPVFLYYYEQYLPENRRPTFYRVPPDGVPAVTPDNVNDQLSAIATDHDRLWLASFERAMQDEDNLVQKWLDARYERPLNVTLGYNHLSLYKAEATFPSVQRLDPQQEFDHPLGDGRLRGVDLPTREFRPGDTAHLGLYSEGGAEPIVVKLVSEGDLVLDTRRATPVGDGAVHRYDVPFPIAYGPPGRYRFALADGTLLARLRIRGTDFVPDETVVQHPMSVQMGADANRVDFLGYDLAPRKGQASGELNVTLYWRAPSDLTSSYTAFVQLVGPHNPETGNPLWGQHDGVPVQGTFPTERWPAGLIVRDHHKLTIASDAPPGDYRLIAGLYNSTTGERLPVPDAPDNAILLQPITISR